MTSLKYKNNQSVLVIIYAESTHRVLMLQRRDDTTFWQSVTGTLERNETPRETAIREVWEEVVNGVTYRYTCKENGEIVVSPLP